MEDNIKLIAEKAISDISSGKMVVVLDDEHRENEADLIMAGEKSSLEAINFMTKNGRGLICVPITHQRAVELDFHPMISINNNKYPQELHGCNFTISVDYKHGTTTGISVFDRSTTILAICDKKSSASDFARPGHIFPLVAHDGGIVSRSGHTEAGVELARLAGLVPVAVICEILKDDGSMMRGKDVIDFAKKFNLNILNIRDLKEYVKK